MDDQTMLRLWPNDVEVSIDWNHFWSCVTWQGTKWRSQETLDLQDILAFLTIKYPIGPGSMLGA